ncbi:MAG: amidophosphoribosyltransferase [Burkholderiales bacterium]|nr:amidophosphoribosyltransferase [Burkholderiales bacterium]
MKKIIPLKEIPTDYNTSDKMEEECGVFAVYNKDNVENIANLAYCGLFALQHRGQESAGITLLNDGYIETIKGMGLVSEVFDQDQLSTKVGNAVIAHVRYSTTGSSTLANAQPLSARSILGDIALAHNGNLVNANRLRHQMELEGNVFQSSSDSEVILNMIARRSKMGIEEAVKDTCNVVSGGYAIVMLIARKLVAVRDPLGIRPLCIGKIHETGTYILASESCALDIAGAELIRDVNPGEMIVIDENGLHSSYYIQEKKRASCSFEYIYFARPDSILDGQDVYHVRGTAGRYLARQGKVDADVVIGVPDSGIVAAIGYSEESGIPYSMGLVRSKYMGRSFILPTQQLREQAVKLKLNPMRQVVSGKRIVLVDDSLVRGTTAKKLIKLMRDAGATEVHFRLASPMVKSECFFGVDISSKEELIASKMNIEQMCKEVGADSLDFLSIENQREILGGDGFCEGCFTGSYPINDVEPIVHEDHVQGMLDFE